MQRTSKSLAFSAAVAIAISAACAQVPLLASPKPVDEAVTRLPEASIGAAYEYQFQAEGGLPPLTWRVTQGELPPGLKLESTGKLHGLPTQARREAYAFIVEVTDSASSPQQVAQSLSLLVKAAPLRIVAAQPALHIVTGIANLANTGLAPAAMPANSLTPDAKPHNVQASIQSSTIPANGTGSAAPMPSTGSKDATTSDATASAQPSSEGEQFDWGRVRAYFSAGVMFSKERDSFSQQDMMIGFNVDSNWWQRNSDEIWGKRFGPPFFKPFTHFNTFFEAKLGAAPVITPAPASSPTTATNPTPTPTPASGNSTGCKDNASIDCFLASRKVATMQIGGYAPAYFSWMKWEFNKSDNAIFIAPLAKAGIQTITSQEVERNNLLRGDDVFNFFGFGARIGHFQLSNRNRSPELISYLDIVSGKWENFDLQTPVLDKNRMPVLNEDKTPAILKHRDWRIGIEGRLKIPQTPLFVGFDANLGKGPDDLRFVFGMRFDMGKLFGSLKSLQSQNP